MLFWEWYQWNITQAWGNNFETVTIIIYWSSVSCGLRDKSEKFVNFQKLIFYDESC